MTETNIDTNTITFIGNSYNITVSLQSEDSIYFSLVNNTTWQNYESVIYRSDIDSIQSLNAFYKIVLNSFSQLNVPKSESESNYSVSFNIKPNLLELEFEANLEGFYLIKQKIYIKENNLSGDKVVSMKLNEIESRYKREITELKNTIDELINSEIIFGYAGFGKFIKYSPKTKILDFTKLESFFWTGNFMDLNKLTSVGKIILHTNQLIYRCKQDFIRYSYSGPQNFDIINSRSTDYQYCYSSNHNSNSHPFILFLNIFDEPRIYLPSVTEIKILYSSVENMEISALRSLPNLNKITFNGFGGTQLMSLAVIKSTPKLKFVTYESCINIANFDEIKTWCASKGIKVDVKS